MSKCETPNFLIVSLGLDGSHTVFTWGLHKFYVKPLCKDPYFS